MQNTIYLTLGQAAKETGQSKSTIFKALESGKLSYVEKTSVGYKIDPAELFRVFPMGGTMNTRKEQSGTIGNTTENDYLKRENDLLRKQLEREQADYWRLQATNLLTQQPSKDDNKNAHSAPENDQETPKPEQSSRLWKKLFGNR
jgi:hypothetical protein